MKIIKHVSIILTGLILSLFSIFSEHNIIRLIGATSRYCIDHIFNTTEKGRPIKTYWSYEKEEGPQTQLLDAILGFVTIGILAYLIINLADFFMIQM